VKRETFVLEEKRIWNKSESSSKSEIRATLQGKAKREAPIFINFLQSIEKAN